MMTAVKMTTTTTVAEPIRAVAYLRVSTEKQRPDLDRQIEKIRVWAQENNVIIIQVFSEVVNGALSSAHDRPELHACIRAALQNGLQVVVVDPSRITRRSDTAEKIAGWKPVNLTFVERHPGYGNKPWALEVAEVHSKLQEQVSIGTAIGMDQKKRNGQKFGGPDGGKAGRAASAAVRGAKSLGRANAIADVLESFAPTQNLTCQEMCAVLDRSAIRPARRVKWSAAALRRPLADARRLVAERAHSRSVAERGGTNQAVTDALVTSEITSDETVDLSAVNMVATDAKEQHSSVQNPLYPEDPDWTPPPNWGRF